MRMARTLFRTLPAPAEFLQSSLALCQPGWLSRYSDSLEVERIGTRPDRPWDHLNILYNGYRAFIPVQRPKPGPDRLTHPALRLKKEYSNTCSVEMADSCSLRGQALYIAPEPALTRSLLGWLSARRPAGNVLPLG
jgi:hypothetical protein